MQSGMDPLNIVLLAATAIILWRLWAVLGKRTGLEKPPRDVVMPRAEPAPVADERFKESEVPVPRQPVWQGTAEAGSSMATALEAIEAKTPGFTVPTFLNGATAAYEMILEAFAKGDKPALKSLLAKEVYDDFSSEIDRRAKNGATMQFQFVGMKKAIIQQATVSGTKAHILVYFVAELIGATRDATGAVTEGDEKNIRQVGDRWTFERDLQSRDPNWKLVATDDDA